MRVKYSAGQKVAQFLGLGVLGSGVCGALLLYRRDERFYRSLSSAILRVSDGETAHRLALMALSKGLYFHCRESDLSDISVTHWGLNFKNPVGVAAGFDKDGEAVTGLTDIGFGFVEVGSVTPEAQEGNTQLGEVSDEAGINTGGHLQVRRRLELLRAGGFNGILGISLAQNKNSASAASDYVAGVKQFSHLADYLVIDISSSNTPGLSRQELKNLLQTVLSSRRGLNLTRPPPLLVKISPNLSSAELKDIAEVVTAPDSRVDGLVISSNTGQEEEELQSVSTATISTLYSLTAGKVPIVGGVTSIAEARQKVLAGASLVQINTGWLVSQGPPLVTRVRRELSDLVLEGSFPNIQEAVGAASTGRD